MSVEPVFSPEPLLQHDRAVAAPLPALAFDDRWAEWKARGIHRDHANRRKSGVALLVLMILVAFAAVMSFLHGAA